MAQKSGFQKLSVPSITAKQAFAGAGKPIFSNVNASAEEDGDDAAHEPDIHFEPVIPLPDLVEVKTGEEDETPIFTHRAKLFRYDAATKQWKERGVGDIKILRHNEKTRFRIILRRDQVHNVACNHCITEDMPLTPLATSETAVCWNAFDFSDGQGEASQFAVRFKHKEQLINFKQTFVECQKELRNSQQDSVQEFAALPSNKELESNFTDSGKSPDINAETEDTNTSQAAQPENDDYRESDEEDEDIIFDKRASLEVFDEASSKFLSAGMGNLKVTYDDSVYGYRITMVNDSNQILCDHIIAVQTCLRIEGRKGIWAAIDLSVEPVKRRQFCATFSSREAINEFNASFEEGKEIAIKSAIVEKTD